MSFASFGYSVTKKGRPPLLFFSGLNQSENIAKRLVSYADYYTIYTFDLPFQGSAVPPPSTSCHQMTSSQWRDLFGLFFEKEKITTTAVMGFSIGGRVALELFTLFPDRVRALFLVAPDGLTTPTSVFLLTRTWFGRFFLGQQSHFLGFSMFSIKVLKKMGVISEQLARQLANLWVKTDHRNQIVDNLLYYCMTGKRYASVFKKTSHQKKVVLFAAKKDHLIPFQRLKSISKKYPLVRFVSVDTGHNQLFHQISFHPNMTYGTY